MTAAILTQILALTSGACVDGTMVSCTLTGCNNAYKVCEYPGFGPCECYDPPPQSCGYIAGTLQFNQWQGGFCPTTRDCTGASYLQAEFGTYVALRDTKFQILAESGSLIGSGATDANGNFIASWCISGTVSTVDARVTWRAEHKDNRFFVRDANGTAYALNSTAFQLLAGTTSGSPQRLANPLRWGQPGLPNPVANIYDGAWRTWNSLRVANRTLGALNNLEIRADSTVCPTSCAFGESNLIHLDLNAEYSPQARVMHEIGHIVSHRASKDGGFRSSGAYCFPNTGSGCGWTFDTEEWASVGFEEGFATFLGDTALYVKNATRPHTCYASAQACASGYFEIDITGTCVAGQNRWPITVSRYLWDVYDSSADRIGENVDRSLSEILDTIYAFPNGEDNHQKDEPWFGSNLDDLDGRSAEDFRYHLHQAGVSTYEAFQGNCSPVGD